MTEPVQPKKRGGQPGNTNAVKHGYFAATLHKRSLEKLPARFQPTRLSMEKQFIGQLTKRIEKQFEPSLSHWTGSERQVHILGTALYILTSLLQSKGIVGDVLNEACETALAGVVDELIAGQEQEPPGP